MKKILFTLLVSVPVTFFFAFGLGGLAQRYAYQDQLYQAIALVDQGVDFSGLGLDLEHDPLSQTIAKIWGHGSAFGYQLCMGE